MEKCCKICGNQFQTIKNGGSRKFCFSCVPITDDINERTNTKRNSIKRQGVKNLGGHCRKCNEIKEYLLDFHHIEKNEKEHVLANLIGDSKVDLFFEEIKKCVLLCGNCHREFHYLEYQEKITIEKFLNDLSES